MRQTEFKNVDPPLWVAWNQALASIRVRFLRQAVTGIGIALGLAFFASVQVMRLAEQSTQGGDAVARLQWLVATSLVMCLVGVTNSMLMSVTERYREIGTIKCLGASDSFIVKVFFLEAMLLGCVGSLVGGVVGAALTAAALAIGDTPVPVGSLLGIIGSAAAIGILLTVLAAVAPAVQAARMPAAAALRMDV
jgi:putative ABC transport system permease protein